MENKYKCKCGGTYNQQRGVWISRLYCNNCEEYIDLSERQNERQN